MVACGVLLIAGVLVAIRWSGLPLTTPAQWQSTDRVTVAESVRRYLWWLAVATVCGLGAGLLVAGAGGRLIMRLLAVTSPESRGQLTEADEVVGEISLGGTLGFIVFGGLLAGALTSVLYLLIRRWLPAGRIGALTFGLLLLLLASTRLEPMRADNLDFVLVGPPWLAVLTFAALTLLHAMAIAGIAARFSRSIPALSRRPSTLLRYAPVLLILLSPPVALVALAACVIFVIVSRLPASPPGSSRRILVAGRVLGGSIALVALPGFVSAIIDVLAFA